MLIGSLVVRCQENMESTQTPHKAADINTQQSSATQLFVIHGILRLCTRPSAAVCTWLPLNDVVADVLLAGSIKGRC